MSSSIFHIVHNYQEFEDVFNKLGTCGYSIALDVRNVSPAFAHSTYSEAWVAEYTERRYAWLDPVIQYLAFGNGEKRWSELTHAKVPLLPNLIMKRAKTYGMKYGLVIARRDSSDSGSKHMLSLARSDRELTDAEITLAATTFDGLLDAFHANDALTPRQLEILTLFAKGNTRAEIAAALCISDETVKKDADKARLLWGARNITEAVGLAVSRKLIDPYQAPKW